MIPLTDIRACVFDAYGTVFDFASAAARCAEIPEDKRSALTALWRDKQLQYTWLRALQGRYADFWQSLGMRSTSRSTVSASRHRACARG